MAEWIIEGQPSLDAWEMDSRRFGPSTAAATTRWCAPTRSTRPTTTSSTPATSARPVGRSVSPAGRTATSAPPSARRAAGSGSTGSSPTHADGDESTAARRLGRHALVAGDRRRAPGLSRDAPRSSTRVPSPSSRSSVPGRRAFLERLCANGSPRPSGGHLHPAAQPPRGSRVRPDGHAAGRGPLPHRDRHGLRQPRRRLDPPHTSRTTRSSSRTSRRVRLLRALGTARARHPAAAHRPRPLARGLRVHEARRSSTSAPVPCLAGARHVRRRARLGALLSERVRVGLWDTLMAAGRPTA
jgi:hypothetical protein